MLLPGMDCKYINYFLCKDHSPIWASRTTIADSVAKFSYQVRYRQETGQSYKDMIRFGMTWYQLRIMQGHGNCMVKPLATNDWETHHETFSWEIGSALSRRVGTWGGFTWRVKAGWPCLGLAVKTPQSESASPFLVLSVKWTIKQSSQFVLPPTPVFKANFSGQSASGCGYIESHLYLGWLSAIL